MRAWEPEPGELRSGGKPWEAFKVYRDLGPVRTLRAVAEALYGERSKYGKRTVEKWSSKFDWVERARAFDNWLEMRDRAAVEAHINERAADYAARREELRLLNFKNEERAAEQVSRVIEQIEKTPLVRSRTVRVEDGRAVEYVIESAVGPMDLAAQRLHKIAKGSEPEKLALTDPTGEREHGRSAEDIDREFEEAFGPFDDGDS